MRLTLHSIVDPGPVVEAMALSRNPVLELYAPHVSPANLKLMEELMLQIGGIRFVDKVALSRGFLLLMLNPAHTLAAAQRSQAVRGEKSVFPELANISETIAGETKV